MQAATATHSLGSATRAVRSKWGWFVALGVGMLIAGGIASSNLFVASLVSVAYIAAFMLVGGAMQIVHAFAVHEWSKRALPIISGLLYVVAGAVAFFDPLLASASISLVLGVFLSLSGVSRVAYGVSRRAERGWGWIVASGVVSLIGGILVVATWPGIGLWLLGALLTFDLIFQGWGFIAFGFMIRRH